MKFQTLSFRVTDRQGYFLQELAKNDHRTLEQFLYVLLVEGTSLFLECRQVSVKKRTEDFTKEELEKIARFDKAQEENEHPFPSDCYVCRYFTDKEIEEVLDSLTDNIFNEELINWRISYPFNSEVEPDLCDERGRPL